MLFPYPKPFRTLETFGPGPTGVTFHAAHCGHFHFRTLTCNEIDIAQGRIIPKCSGRFYRTKTTCLRATQALWFAYRLGFENAQLRYQLIPPPGLHPRSPAPELANTNLTATEVLTRERRACLSNNTLNGLPLDIPVGTELLTAEGWFIITAPGTAIRIPWQRAAHSLTSS